MGGDEHVSQHVSIKAPAFMETCVSGWFQIMEAQFHLANISKDDTKYFHVLASLPPDTVSRLPQYILTTHNYVELKKFVTQLYEQSKTELFDKLMSDTPLTGRPSLYMEELRRTAGKVGVGDDLVRHKFFQSLPQSIAPVLIAQKDLSLDQLSRLADELMPFVSANCMTVQSDTRFSKDTSSKSSKTNTHIPYGVKPFSNDQQPRICRFHIYYAEKAHSCKPWCRWPNKSNLRILPNSRPASPAPNRDSLSSEAAGN